MPRGSILDDGITHQEYFDLQHRRRSLLRRAALRFYRRYRPWIDGVPFLEIGVGSGHFLSHLIRLAPPETDIVGVDIDPDMIEKAAMVTPIRPNVRLLALDAGAPMPFAAGTFALIYSEHTFHHAENPDEVMAEASRVLRDDGVFVLMDINPKKRFTRLIYFIGSMMRRMKIRVAVAEATVRSIERSLPDDRIEQMARDCGLRVAKKRPRLMDTWWELKKG